MFYDDLTGADGQPPNAQEMAQRRQANQAAADPGLWERAEAHNPDPARFCPVQVTSPAKPKPNPNPNPKPKPKPKPKPDPNQVTGFENLLARQKKQAATPYPYPYP